MHDLLGCNEESCDRNNKKECQILDDCKTIKTEHLFRCDQGDALDDMRLQNGDGIHAGDKPYKCGICNKELRWHGDLQRHIITHTGDKPDKCDICGNGFTQNYTLKVHMRTHTGDKPNTCDVCDKEFRQKRNLQQHIRTHTGDKPYKCDVCVLICTFNV